MSASQLNEVHRDTTNAIRGATATLLITCLSAVILTGVDDSVILGNQTVSTPFVGQTRYNLFVWLAPAFITALRIYVDLQLDHLSRLAQIIERRSILTSSSLSPSNSAILRIAGAVTIHLVPPLSIVMIGYHASALYPERGLLLYSWAAALLLWSLVQILLTRPRRFSLGVAAALVLALVLSGVLLGNRERTFCERRYEGITSALTPAVLRLPEFLHSDLAEGNYVDENFSCARMEFTTFRAADLRFARFWFASLLEAKFERSMFSYAEFDGARLRHTDMSGGEGPFSQFFDTDLDGSNFSNAKLEHARFNLSRFDQTDFSNARLEAASFYKAKLRIVNFTDSDLSHAKFDYATLNGVDFTRAQLQHAHFDGASFSGGTFKEADLSCSSFLGASLKDVDFSGVAPGGLRGVQFPEDSKRNKNQWPVDYDPAAAASGVTPECTTER